MFNSLVRFWCSLSSDWIEFWFEDDFKRKPAVNTYQLESEDIRLNWWEFLNLEEVTPLTWYANGEIIEA